MPVFKIHHITKYTYDSPVTESMNEIKIFPFVGAEQETITHDLLITYHPDVQLFDDYWGNQTGIFNILIPHRELIIESKMVIRTIDNHQSAINFHSNIEQLSEEKKDNLQLIELSNAKTISRQHEIKFITDIIYTPGKSIAATVEACNEYIFANFQYIKGITTIETTVDEILEHKSGVCQDFAHLMLQILRTLHIPSRYVSGYICPNKNGMRGEGATHAWVEAWIPHYGWAGIDPTNNTWTTSNHVKLAVGSEFKDCSPARGTFKGTAKQLLSVYVSVGYEDGQIFEEVNDVKMDGLASAKEVALKPIFAGQQQQ